MHILEVLSRSYNIYDSSDFIYIFCSSGYKEEDNDKKKVSLQIVEKK